MINGAVSIPPIGFLVNFCDLFFSIFILLLSGTDGTIAPKIVATGRDVECLAHVGYQVKISVVLNEFILAQSGLLK
jgi:hypothetical protein